MMLDLQNEAFPNSQEERHRVEELEPISNCSLFLLTQVLTKGGLHRGYKSPGQCARPQGQCAPPPTFCLASFQQQQQKERGDQ